VSICSVVDFWRKVQTDPTLQATLGTEVAKHAPEHRCVRGAQVARDAGFDVTPEELLDVGAVAAFWSRVERDPALREKLAPAQASETPELAMHEITRVANEAGFQFSLEALQHVTGALVNSGRATAPETAEGVELSDDQLADVSGGALEVSLDLARRRLWQETMHIGPGVVGAKP
jgi:predicted ribosomally synthesized peptide with nif11-like leader